MAVIVTTGGPISGIPTVLAPQIKTFTDLINSISDDLDDTNNEYLAQIQEAIFSAIRFCEREPFYFNESREVSFFTKQDQEFYSTDDNEAIATLAGLSQVYCQRDNNHYVLLAAKPPEFMETRQGNERGEPIYYSYFGQKLRFYPIPDTAYQIRLQLSPVRFRNITSANEPNPWFYEAFDLIRARAKYELYKDILKDGDIAASALNDFYEQLAALRAETSRRNGRGRIYPTNF
ncbi:hypothetical protein N5853_01935 [Bartonella sp. HY329]|uniref:phage adaptor protein n=1 Tax=unclassified Bartonella TaxID=2645622 RepID=UPI0021C5C970|nr:MULTISPECIES: hypothetical protein [unclassified Bartonella]UXM95428.1 hypothetical protein N5853_01935 [Bartonella sp. HY329]UXN09753.1 hypothetical protein N5852_01940 [Bartonella sp. HY328]